MEPKTRFLIWWILTMIPVMTCKPIGGKCPRVIERINYTKDKTEIILDEFVSTHKNVNEWPERISELDLKNLNTEEKLQRAQCGLHYMEKAVKLICEHQNGLHGKCILDNITTILNVTTNCVKHTIGDCTNGTEPEFPYPHLYEKIQWSRTVLNVFVEFLVELVNVVNEHALKPTPNQSVRSKHHKIKTA